LGCTAIGITVRISRDWHGITLIGLVTLSLAPSLRDHFGGAGLVGIGSSVFHPESSGARMAFGGQHGMAQSLFRLAGTRDRR